MSRFGSTWHLRNQRSMSNLDARICLTRQLLGADVCGDQMRKARMRGRGDLARLPKVPSPRQTGRTGSECRMMPAPILVYIVGGIPKF